MVTPERARWVALLHDVLCFGARRPKLAVLIGVVLFLASLAIVPFLNVSTSRTKLVSGEHPYQHRLLSFYERFGYPEQPIVVVSGGTSDERRKVVDALVDAYDALPAFHGRVLARVTPENLAEVAFLVEPQKVLESLGKMDIDAAKIEADGIVGASSELARSARAGLEGKVDAGGPAAAETGFASLRTLLETFEQSLDRTGGVSLETGLATQGAAAQGIDDRGYLVGAGDKHLIALFPDGVADEGYQVRPLVAEMRKVRDRIVCGTDGVICDPPPGAIRADITGLPALVTDELDLVENDLARTGVGSTVLIVLTLYFAFRTLRQAAVSFIPLGFGTLVTFALAKLIVGDLNVITASFTSVLLGLGDFGVHIQSRYAELLRAGEEPQAAMEEALTKSFAGLFLGTATTAVAFLTTMTTEFTAFAQLGFITSLGLLVMFFGTYLLVPPMVMWMLGKKPRPSPEYPGMVWLSRTIGNNYRLIPIVSFALVLPFVVFLPKVHFSPRYFDFLPPHVESARALNLLEDDVYASPITAHIAADGIEEARELATRLRALPSVGSVESPSDFFAPWNDANRAAVRALAQRFAKGVDFEAAKKKPVTRADMAPALRELGDVLDEAAFGLREAGKPTTSVDGAKAALKRVNDKLAALPDEGRVELGRMNAAFVGIVERAAKTVEAVDRRGGYAPSDLTGVWRRRFVSKDGNAVAVFVHPKKDVWDAANAAEFRKDVESVAPEASGLALTIHEHVAMIVRGLRSSSIAAAILVVAILGLTFRRLRDVLIAAVPLLLGAVLMLGSMQPLGLAFNHANVVVMPLLLGLGVESGAHIMSRYKQSAAEHGGVATLDDILRGAGGAVITASLTTVFGFSVMLLASYRAMYGLGLLMTIGMTATLVASLVVIPALLKWTGRAR